MNCPPFPDFAATLEVALKNKSRRNFPDRDDARYINGCIFPSFGPKFQLDFNSADPVFTMGSCFARNIEEVLEAIGVSLPMRRFKAPISEWPYRPNGLLNEFNPGSIARRIVDALDGRASPVETIVQTGAGYADLLLPGGADVALNRALQRRAEIFEIYERMQYCQAVIITLGMIECWFDTASNCFLNRMPPRDVAMAQPDRYCFRRLDVDESMTLLEGPISRLDAAGVKVILTVSPVPLRTTFTEHDAVVANEYSKAVLRICAEKLSKKFDCVDYFPAYEIVRSMGGAGFQFDNLHVMPEVVRSIAHYMVGCYPRAA